MTDFRTAGEHDCDRIIYSSAYRRLAGVTQVVGVGERQLFHNRLTHTQKVAQLSRRIAQNLVRSHGVAVDPDVAEAAGHAHDLGHPPFGHIAEAELSKACIKHKVDGFEGNAQSFRIVTRLSVRRSGRGLSLSQGTLNGILKYPWLSNARKAKAKSKWGAYLTERAEFEIARNGDRTHRQSIEAAVMDLADDISYAVHDLEDFYRVGLIPLHVLANTGLPAGEVERQDFLGRIAEGMERKSEPWNESEAAKALLGLMEVLPFVREYSGTSADRRALSRVGSKLIDRYVTSAKARPSGDLLSDTLRCEIEILKQLTKQYVVNGTQLATMQRGQVEVIRELFRSLHSWAMDDSERARLPMRLREFILLAEAETYGSQEAAIARAVADYIATLTEDQAVALHNRLTGVATGSVQDSWMS